ncbi:alcohol dehydrogenase transcription factor myb/SANT-like domain-containing protein [Phthorimaea operculella]|nr:alcohol dehydrogenase transcription factor myb/SANT-like domain-containing protein [Phthorimaea operculella]
MRMSEGQMGLIEAVKKRPLLYSRYHPQFSDRKLKLGLWYEVCGEILPGWSEFSSGKKGEMVCEIQRQWKTLRDGFSRELSFQRRDKQKKERGEYVRKRKIYGYFKPLKFLLKQKRKPDEENGEEQGEEDEMEYDSGPDNADTDGDTREEYESHSFKTEPGTSYYVDVGDIAEPVVAKAFESAKSVTIDTDKVSDEDDDKLFCLSLIPSFKKMTEKQKYDARIGIMQVLSEIRFRNNEETPQPPI